MTRILLLISLLALTLAACVPSLQQAPAAQRYAADFDTALANTIAAFESLDDNGYGPYELDTQGQANGILSASWTSGAGVTYRITANILPIDGGSEIAIQGSTSNPEQSTLATVLYLYGELDSRMTRLE